MARAGLGLGSLCPQQQALQSVPGAPGLCPSLGDGALVPPLSSRPRLAEPCSNTPVCQPLLPGGGCCSRCPHGQLGCSCHPSLSPGGGHPAVPSPAACRYQLPSQEEAKERRHSHAVAGLPESDDQSELPSPPALSMSLSSKGQLTNIGQYLRGLPRGQGGQALGSASRWVPAVRAGSRSLHSPPTA